MYRWLHSLWYDGNRAYWLLTPLSALFWLVSSVRRAMFRNGWLKKTDVGVPLIIVGNITAGGTGKTPVTIWLAEQLKGRGLAPGIVSRGYGGSGADESILVDESSDPSIVGDEPVLMARRSGVPVAVDADRARGAGMLVQEGADVIIADDGLQHYALHRSYEICVIDGERRLGNRQLLPAGPLRETPRRLLSVDQVLMNGSCSDPFSTSAEQNALCFDLKPDDACRANGSLARPIQNFAGETVHAVAAIGNPSRFFDMLRQYGIEVIEHPFRDHDTIDLGAYTDGKPVFMTEKDVVKLSSPQPDHIWYVPVSLSIDPVLANPWLEQVQSRITAEQKSHA